MTNMSAPPALTPPSVVWRPDDTAPAVPACPDTVYREDILATIEQTVKALDGELRHATGHPELGYEEYRTHDVLTAFMGNHGFEVKKKYHLETAWLATFSNGTGGRTIGINSEMDALKGVGHACGHNLIAIAGVAVACAIKAVFEKFNISGKIQLLGTPAEEGGLGKVKLLDAGCYKEMDACLISCPGVTPAPGPKGSVSLSSCLAMERLTVEYFGHTAHAALSPWEGRNALDAAVLGYNNISALRQQLRPTHRVHGIFEGKDWAPNIIPDYAKYICYVRAPTVAEQKETLKRVIPCFDAAALATGCTVKVSFMGESSDIRQNKALGDEVAHIVRSKYGDIDYEWGIKSASTDFGNVTYALPSLHPGFGAPVFPLRFSPLAQWRLIGICFPAIPTVPDGGNHTRGFADAAATMPAHYACLDVVKALAATGVRVVIDDHFYAQVKKTFEEDKAVRSLIN
ncbi:Peptidase M20 domain-containing protein 2 [Mycena sanguinolenta]|uniref:Peptidase M20 domain-containing protein 2 n=1 Tax=Mycena sanguinolenta TaxID=230812 RepID=A0A8H6YT66_9AGAR|nr:Peptidase M20 domain-containing protein 2 [Mycena sanguinolenta]